MNFMFLKLHPFTQHLLSQAIIVSGVQVSFPLPWNIVTKIGEYKGSQRKIGTSLLLVAVGQLFVF